MWQNTVNLPVVELGVSLAHSFMLFLNDVRIVFWSEPKGSIPSNLVYCNTGIALSPDTFPVPQPGSRAPACCCVLLVPSARQHRCLASWISVETDCPVLLSLAKPVSILEPFGDSREGRPHRVWVLGCPYRQCCVLLLKVAEFRFAVAAPQLLKKAGFRELWKKANMIMSLPSPSLCLWPAIYSWFPWTIWPVLEGNPAPLKTIRSCVQLLWGAPVLL